MNLPLKQIFETNIIKYIYVCKGGILASHPFIEPFGTSGEFLSNSECFSLVLFPLAYDYDKKFIDIAVTSVASNGLLPAAIIKRITPV